MQIFHSFAELHCLERPVHWAIGFFDGVHRGHVRVMHSADTPDALRGVITFARHPLALLRPASQPPLITPRAEYKARLIDELGKADVLLCLPFDARLAALTPEQFLDTLGEACRVAGISVGENWRFGAGGCGNAERLRHEGTQRGWHIRICPLEHHLGAPVSSQRIRAALAGGNISLATALLGHPFVIAGRVEHGQHLARRLGFPTANIPICPHSALPPAGVYAVSASVQNAELNGIANLGLRPSIAEQRKLPRLEVHFPHWQGDLYGCSLAVQLRRFMRPEQQFPSLDALQAQVLADISSLDSQAITPNSPTSLSEN